MSALFGLPPPLTRWLAIAMVAAVVALVAWALQLMQAASDRQEFSLMLAGCMVCSAAVGLSTVMVLTFTSPETFALHGPSTLETFKASGAADAGADGFSSAIPWRALPPQGGSPL
ncbi:MAG: hypothetical protein ACK6AD_14600 [Cyanobacteriota bacterium]